MSLFSLYGQRFLGYGASFKIAIYGHENWILAKVQGVAHTLILPKGVESECNFALRAAVSEIRLIFKFAIFGHETWPLAKVPEVAHILSFYPKVSKLSLFLVYGQRFPRYRPIFKLGHETWPLPKVPKNAHILSFYPKGSKLSLFSVYRWRLPRYEPILEIAIFWHETWQVAKVPEVTHNALFLPQEVESELIFAPQAAVSEIQANFQSHHIWA